MTEWYLYMVRCCDGSLYTGISTEISRRLEEHQAKGNKGAKYLRGRGPLELVYHKKLGNKALASKLEYKIKKLSKLRKEAIIEESPNSKELLRKCKLISEKRRTIKMKSLKPGLEKQLKIVKT